MKVILEPGKDSLKMRKVLTKHTTNDTRWYGMNDK